MKNSVLAVLAVALFSAPVFAQETTTTTRDEVTPPSAVSSRGVRVSLLKPIISASVQSNSSNATASSDTTELKNTLGIYVGYANLRVGKVGFTAGATYMDLKEKSDDETIGLLRADGNIAYAINRVLNIKGGINISQITRTVDGVDITPGVGFQTSLGIQFTQTVGIDIAYVEMNQTCTSKYSVFGYRPSVNLKEKGPEISFTATF